ncbi:MAG TPA: alpha/beta hydrolase [Chloroflexota bacterium]|nr:alpha/beta hydrolase [Chloroflexota bacterium]
MTTTIPAAGLLTGGATPLTVAPGLRALEIGAHRVEYVLLGEESAPPLVILHGGSCSADDWSNVAPVFAARHRVVVADGLVHPFDPWRLWLLLDHLGIERAPFIVHSAGGMTWRAMYRLQPHRVSGVVSIDTQGVGNTIVVRLWPHERFSPQAAAMYERRRAEMEALKPQHQGDYPSDVNIAIRNVAYHRHTLTPEQRAATRPAPRLVERYAGPVPSAPALIPDDGKFIACPVLVIHTGRGKLGPEDISAEWIEQNIQAKDVQYEVIREASHWPWLEQPEWFLQLVSPFLDRCPAPPS